MTNSAPPAPSRVNEIDLLRFLAALAVVFYHYTFRGYAADAMSVMPYPSLAPFFKYGYMGVHLFFMISGFVILMTAADGSLRSFAVSRISRLYPAFWACCTITFAAIVAFGAPRYAASLRQYLVNMTMLSGFVGVPSLDGVYWSLFVEMRFYALVALVLAAGWIRRTQPLLAGWLLVSIALELSPLRRLRYLALSEYSAYFIAGAAFFLIWSRGFTAARGGLIAGSWGLAVFQMVRGIPEFEKTYSTSMSAAAIGGIITVFFLTMLTVSLRRTGFLGRRRWQLAGALTYPLYLLHENLGFILFNAAYPAVDARALLCVAVAGALAAAYAVNALVEKRCGPALKRALGAAFGAAGKRAGLTQPLM